MDDPQYVVLVVLDEPKPEKEGMGATAGLNAAPTVGAGDPPFRAPSSASSRAPSIRTASSSSPTDNHRETLNRTHPHDMLLQDLVADGVTLPEGAGAIDIKGITADSRAVAPGFLFAALPGSTTDGGRFVGAAAANGAVAVLAGATRGDRSAAGRRSAPRRRPAARLVAGRGPALSAPAGASGRGHRHQRARPPSPPSSARSAPMPALRRRAWGRSASSAGGGAPYGSLTTPDPVALHEALDRLAREGVTHAALEASSHGLDQRRLDGIRIQRRGVHQSRPRPHGLPPRRRTLSRREAQALHRHSAGRRRGGGGHGRGAFGRRGKGGACSAASH